MSFPQLFSDGAVAQDNYRLKNLRILKNTGNRLLNQAASGISGQGWSTQPRTPPATPSNNAQTSFNSGSDYTTIGYRWIYNSNHNRYYGIDSNRSTGDSSLIVSGFPINNVNARGAIAPFAFSYYQYITSKYVNGQWIYTYGPLITVNESYVSVSRILNNPADPSVVTIVGTGFDTTFVGTTYDGVNFQWKYISGIPVASWENRSSPNVPRDMSGPSIITPNGTLIIGANLSQPTSQVLGFDIVSSTNYKSTNPTWVGFDTKFNTPYSNSSALPILGKPFLGEPAASTNTVVFPIKSYTYYHTSQIPASNSSYNPDNFDKIRVITGNSSGQNWTYKEATKDETWNTTFTLDTTAPTPGSMTSQQRLAFYARGCSRIVYADTKSMFYGILELSYGFSQRVSKYSYGTSGGSYENFITCIYSMDDGATWKHGVTNLRASDISTNYVESLRDFIIHWIPQINQFMVVGNTKMFFSKDGFNWIGEARSTPYGAYREARQVIETGVAWANSNAFTQQPIIDVRGTFIKETGDYIIIPRASTLFNGVQDPYLSDRLGHNYIIVGEF